MEKAIKKQRISSPATKDDLIGVVRAINNKIDGVEKKMGDKIDGAEKKIMNEFGKVIEQNILPPIEELGSRMVKVENRLDNIEVKMSAMDAKLDRALYRDLDRHERWIRQIAHKTGVALERY